MQNKMAQMITNLGLRALEKSRGYYHPPSMSSLTEAVEMSDAEFAILLQDIDCFSAGFSSAPEEKNMGVRSSDHGADGSENPPRKKTRPENPCRA